MRHSWGRARWAVLGALVVAMVVPGSARAILPGQLPLPPEPTPVCATEAGTGGVDDGSLRVATFNVLHTQDPDGLATIEQRIPMLVSAIAGSGADVVGLQEAAKSGDHGLVAERLAEGLVTATGDTWHWCWFASNPHIPYEPEPNPGGGGGPLTELAATGAGAQSGNGAEFREGVAVLTRMPLLSASVMRLPLRSHEAVACVPPDPLGCNFAALFDSRVLLHARVDTPSGPLDLYTTHIAHGLTALSDDTKLRQVEAALDHIDATAAVDALPDVFVGDFNSVEGDPRHQAVTTRGFIDTFRAANPEADGFTASQDVVGPALTVDHRIDFVFSRVGSCPVAVTESSVFGADPEPRVDAPGTVWPSDHLAVVSALALACPT
jgi:endonuclease/exonuclease/phosphatase family metal-dependent hydrolase